MTTENNLIVQSDEQQGMMAELTNEKVTMFTSMKMQTVEEKAHLFNAMNSPDGRVSDMIGKVINVKDVFVEMVELTNQETGEVNTAPRIVLIDVNGKSYQAVSVGIFSALKKLFNIFGTPTWEDGIKLEIKQVKSGVNSILTCNVVI